MLNTNMDNEFILNHLRVSADPFALCELNGRCDLGLGQASNVTLHYVLTGQGEILLPNQPSIPISKGSLALIPALQSHVLRSFGETSDPFPSCQPAGLNLLYLTRGADNNASQGIVALCARISISLRNLHKAIDLIRVPMVENATDTPALISPIDQIIHEITNPNLGSRAMIRALLHQAIIAMMRCKLAANDPGLNWTKALSDPRLWPVLNAMLDDPAASHSLESLADIAGMSRSTLAQKFSDSYGSGPMELLRDLRMQRAAELLLQSDLPVKSISALVGFQSRTSFSRAFEATTGQSPRNFRKSQILKEQKLS